MSDDSTRIGAHTPKPSDFARKHAARASLERQIDDLQSQLTVERSARGRLAAVLEAVVRSQGPFRVPIAYLEQHCLGGKIRLELAQQGTLAVVLAEPMAVPEPVLEPHEPSPLLDQHGRPMGDGPAPAVRVVEPGQWVLPNGKIVAEHAGYRAEVVDSIPGYPRPGSA
jgi:hypothetical protein